MTPIIIKSMDEGNLTIKFLNIRHEIVLKKRNSMKPIAKSIYIPIAIVFPNSWSSKFMILTDGIYA